MKKSRQEYKVSGSRKSMMKKNFTALKNGTWEEYKETFKEQMKASEWAFDRLGGTGRGRKDEHCARVHAEKYDNLRRIIAPVGGQGGVTMSYLCPNCNSFPLEDNVWWVSGRETTKWWCAIFGEKYDWRQPNRLLVVQTGESF